MRGLCFVLLVLLAGCATTGKRADRPAVWKGHGLDYAATRPAPETALPAGAVRVDVTLLDLDESVAKQLLGIEGHTDISPRSFADPMGEIAAVNACYGHGRLLAHSKLAMKPGEDALFDWKRDHEYLSDWEVGQDGEVSPSFDTVNEGVTGKLTLKATEDGWSIGADLASAQMDWPIGLFGTATASGTPVSIQTPNLSVMQRVGTETIQPGETAMFQLSRAAHGDAARLRLLFVRIDAPTKLHLRGRR